MKKFILFLSILAINFLIANIAFAENFYFKDYNVDMKVSENKNIQITETMNVVFTTPSHGIFRTIPIYETVTRADDSSFTNNAKIKNITVNKQFSTSKQGKLLKIKIGSPDKLVSGEQSYVIKYDYQPSDDKLKNNDELYMSIITTNWNTPIENASFSIEMPKNFDTSKIGVSVGRYGTLGYNEDELDLYSDGKTIQGIIKRPLNSNEGITIRVLLPKNYFKNDNHTSDIPFIAIIILLTLICFFMWNKYGKDDVPIPIVNFYPPEKKNSAEVYVEYKGNASTKALVSLIIYLANKGYIKIEEDKYNYSLHKLKEYDGQNSIEKGLIDAIFGASDYVTKKDLESSTSFYKDCKMLTDKLNRIKKFIFVAESTSWEKLLLMILCIIGIVLTVIYALNGYYLGFEDICFITFFCVFIGILIFVFSNIKSNSSILSKIAIYIWLIMFLGPTIINAIDKYAVSSEHTCFLVTGFIGLIVSIICLVNMPKRNKAGVNALGQILGFKKFLEVAEKNRIEMLIKENPSYCFDVLPYAYALGVSDEWIKKFESLMIEPPDWYSVHITSRRFSRLLRSLESASVPSTQNGGIDSSSLRGGGGFSGGGCGGGGGGGSW